MAQPLGLTRSRPFFLFLTFSYIHTRTCVITIRVCRPDVASRAQSLVCGVTAAVALLHGVGSSLFSICVGFSLIVMYDAGGVRRHAGKQAEVLNVIVQDMFEGHPVGARKLKELLGHTPLQVMMGAITGVLVALVYMSCLVAR